MTWSAAEISIVLEIRPSVSYCLAAHEMTMTLQPIMERRQLTNCLSDTPKAVGCSSTPQK